MLTWAAFHVPWHAIFTAVQVIAAVLFMLDFFGVFRYARRRLPGLQAVGDLPRGRVFRVAQSLVFVGLMLTLPGLGRIVFGAALVAAVITKEFIEWRHDVA